jgi:hypothetical protein
MNRLLIILALVLAPFAAHAVDGEALKAAHREAAQKYLDSYEKGLHMAGTVQQNDSTGTFSAYYLNDRWFVQQAFGDLEYYNLTSPDGMWDGSNYTLPYELTAKDNPAVAVVSLLADGTYLEEPYWSAFNYVGEEAGGYVFTFAPEGMIPVKVVLFADEDDPEYLQIMSTELKLAPNDPDCYTHRTYYYYKVDDQGRFLLERETGRDIDSQGQTENFIEFDTETVEAISALPDLGYNFRRIPPGGVSLNQTAPATIPVDVTNQYFVIPVTFAGSDKTWHFILDTGASTTLMTPAAAETAGMTYSLTVPTHGHGSKVDFKVGLCKTATLGEAGSAAQMPLAGFVATRIPDDKQDLLKLLAMYGVDGIMGNSPLHQYVITFDHPNSQIIVYPPQLFNPGQDVHPQSVVFELDTEDLIYTKALLNHDIEGDVVIDTGMQDDLSLLEETVNAHGLKLEKVSEKDATVVGGTRTFNQVMVPSFAIGPFELTNQIASLTNDDRGTMAARGLLGFIGVTMFFDTRVTLDLFGERMYVEPPAGAESLIPPGKQSRERPKERTKKQDGEDKQQDGAESGSKSKLPIDIG